MTEVTILNEADLRRMVSFDLPALNAIENAFVALAEGRATMPPIMHLEVHEPRGDVDIKSAVIDGLPNLAVKIGAGFFGNRHLGLPSSSAMMVAISATTGRCSAVLLDNGYLTDLRTALAGAVAARHLARPGKLQVGIIGAGAQARYQVEALMIEHRVSSVRVWAPRPEQVDDYIAHMTTQHGLEVIACKTVEHVVAESDLIVTTTPATSPVVEGRWLRAGQHITAMGSDLPGKRELDFAALDRADIIACDSVLQSCRLGELQGLEGDLAGRAVSLGELIVGHSIGRATADQITICDLSGMGVQDTAIADFVLRSRQASAAFPEH